MIISVDEIMKLSQFKDQDEKTIQRKLNSLELLIRKYTNNNFQNRNIRFDGISTNDNKIIGGSYFLKIGDTVQISESLVNDGLYTVIEIGSGYIKVNKDIYATNHNLVTKVEYPDDVKEGIINLMIWEIQSRDKVGIKSETISRHSVTYFDQDKTNQCMGYPIALLGFLEPYIKARF